MIAMERGGMNSILTGSMPDPFFSSSCLFIIFAMHFNVMVTFRRAMLFIYFFFQKASIFHCSIPYLLIHEAKCKAPYVGGVCLFFCMIACNIFVRCAANLKFYFNLLLFLNVSLAHYVVVLNKNILRPY